jgi:hypothetical protein
MSRATRRVNRAIRITPSEDRHRYAGEWRGDLSSAAELGISPSDVARGATRVAWRLRVRRWGRLLAGDAGGRKATVAWALILIVLPMPLTILVIPATMVVALRRTHAGRWHGGSLVMLVSAVLWLVCLPASWWLLSGVDFEATASLPPEPAAWARFSFLGALGAFVTFWIAFGVCVVRRSAGTKTAA